jgi:hypothetical protein
LLHRPVGGAPQLIQQPGSIPAAAAAHVLRLRDPLQVPVHSVRCRVYFQPTPLALGDDQRQET